MTRVHIAAIDGLRAWLALWVLGAHALQFAGFRAGELSGLPRLLQEGALAVDVFMVVSGFVIFRLLDQQREPYGTYLTRRFFRLYPLYLLMFFCAIPLAASNLETYTQAPAGYLATQANFWREAVANYAQTWPWNIPLHLTMLQGLAPDALVGPHALKAYLPPAWSISLEWQFYLIAPGFYALATSPKAGTRLALGAVIVGLVWAGHHWEWSIAFLPFHLEFFLLGAASYFFYKREIAKGRSALPPDVYFPLTLVLAVSLFLLGVRARTLIPVCLWLAVFGLLLERPGSLSSRAQWLFTNPAAQFLGRISYSIYLCHWLGLILMQSLLARSLPELGQAVHFWVLLTGTLTVTIPASALLHHFVEVPGMKLGRVLAGGSGAKRVLPVPHLSEAPIKSVTST